MKSEERHHLQENELEKFAEQARGWFQQHGQKVGIAAVAVVLILAIGIYVSRSMTAAGEAGWAELQSALATGDPAEVEGIATRFPRSAVGDWATLNAAEMRLPGAIYDQFNDLEISNAELALVQEGFDKVLKSSTAPDDVRERALYGLACVLEAQSDGKPDKAIEAYERLLGEFPETIYQPMVEQRLAALKSDEGGEFYKWFAVAERPNPEDRREPNDGIGGPGSGTDGTGVGEIDDVPPLPPPVKPDEDTGDGPSLVPPVEGDGDGGPGPSLVPPADTDPPGETSTPADTDAKPDPEKTTDPETPSDDDDAPGDAAKPDADAKPDSDSDAGPSDE